MKKMIAFMLCILLVMSAALAVAEEAKPLAGKKLTIALSPNFMFFETVSETEECGYEGLDIDIIKELSNMLGFEFEIVPMSFSSLVGSLQAKSVDMVISGMSYTEERAQIVDFSDVYCTSVVGCVTKVDSEIASFDDLKNQIVCCSQGTNYEMIIEGIEGATFFFRWAACAACAVDESAYAAHLKKLILLGVCDVFINLRQQFGTDTLLDGFENLERVGDGRFLYTNRLTKLHHVTGLHVHAVLGDATVLACVGSDGTCLEDACRP